MNKLVNNAPFYLEKKYRIKLTNAGPLTVDWTIKTENSRVAGMLGAGVLEPEDQVLVYVTCDAYIAKDRIYRVAKIDHGKLSRTVDENGWISS